MGNCIQDIVYKKINLFFIFKKKEIYYKNTRREATFIKPNSYELQHAILGGGFLRLKKQKN